MKDTAPWIFLFVLLVLIAVALLTNDMFIDGLKERVPFALNTTPRPTPTLSAGNAAAEATRVAQEQSAIMTAEAALSELQATTQAGIMQGTRQAAEANQAHLDQEAARQAGATAQAVQVTAEYEQSVATATSAAEATEARCTVAASTATRQVEEDRMTATVESRHATATRQAIERDEKEKDQEHSRQVWEDCIRTALFVVFAAALAASTVLLLHQCLKHMEKWPVTLCALLSIWDEYIRRKK